MIGKDAYIEAVAELVAEYLEAASFLPDQEGLQEQAERYAETLAWERYQDNLADLADAVNDQRKEFRI